MNQHLALPVLEHPMLHPLLHMHAPRHTCITLYFHHPHAVPLHSVTSVTCKSTAHGPFPAVTSFAQAGEEGGVQPLLSAKLHRSWIADVQLLPADRAATQQQLDSDSYASSLPQLLTASNDGSVSLWDLSKCCGGRPLELAHTEALHTGHMPVISGTTVPC